MRIDFITNVRVTKAQLARLPEHEKLWRYGERAIALADTFQMCGNVSADYTPTLAHTVPKELREFTPMFEGYLVMDDVGDAEVQEDEYGLSYDVICGDGGKPLRAFTEGSGKRKLAANPRQTAWLIRAYFSKRRTVPEKSTQWSYTASPCVVTHDQGQWFIGTGIYGSRGDIIMVANRAWLEGWEMKPYPWIAPMFERGKRAILESGLLPDWFKP